MAKKKIAVVGIGKIAQDQHLPVIDKGRMISFVSIGDLVKYRIDRIESEAEAMRSYIQSA